MQKNNLIGLVGKSLILFLGTVLFFTSTVFAGVSADSCDYYSELEAKFKCGPDGYVQTFANPYCRAYLKNNNRFSSKAKIILRDIRYCLQKVLNDNSSGMTCQELEKYGIASHETCYVANGYCDLQGSDLLNVYWIARYEAFNPEIWDMLTRVEYQCSSHYSVLLKEVKTRTQ